jgi:hypothetical protein
MALTSTRLRIEAADGSAAEEYRIHQGNIEVRNRRASGWNRGEDDWHRLTAEQLSSHIDRNTVVARWLEGRLGWQRLVRLCVGQEASHRPIPENSTEHRAA